MIGLEENRVYNIGQIETLRTTGARLLDTGIASCITWDMAISELESLQSGTPVKCAELKGALGAVSGQLNKPEYDTDKYKIDGILSNTIARIPQQDIAGSDALEPLAENLQMIMGMTEDLAGCIGAAGTNLTLAEFQQKLEGIKQEWDDTALEDNLQMFETILIGMPGDVAYAADPVNMSTGNFIYRYTDLSIKGERPLTFMRTYNAMSRRKGILGRCWIHNWEKRLEEKDGKLILYHEDGREEHFFAQEAGGEEEILPIGVYRSKGSLEILILKNENGNAMLTRNGQPAEYYDEAGRLILCEEGNGIKTALKYEEDRLTKIRRNTGEEICLFYDEKGHLTEVKDHTGRKVSLSYSGKKLVSVTDPEGHAFRYEYGANGRISRIYDKRGVCILENEYDDYRRVTIQRFPDGGVIQFDYQNKKKNTRLTEQNGNKVTYIHDKQFREKRIVSDAGCEEWEYDAKGHVSRKKDRNNGVSDYVYDKDGRLIEETNPLGEKTLRTYDERGRLVSVTHPDNTKDVLGYDTYGRLNSVTDRAGEKVTLSYMEEERRPHMITLADGSEMHLCCDERGNILFMTYPDGVRASYEYDDLNRVIGHRDGNGNVTHFTYDGLDRIRGIQRPDGTAQQITYNSMGEATEIQDFDGYTMKWEYNVLNKPSVYEDKQGRKTFMEYDLMWNMSRLTDPEGSVTEYAYDKQNRLESVTDPLGRKVSFTYDADGNRTGVCYPDGTKNCYEYDALNHIISETDRADRVTRREYDCMGNLLIVTDNAGEKTCYTYDKCGRKLTETDRTGAVTRYIYTPLGKIESIIHPGGRTERWQYGPGGRLDRYEKGDGTWEAYGYDKNGNLTSKRYQDGNEHTYRYDCLNRMTDILLNGEKEKSYTYDAMGNVTSMEDASGRITRHIYSPTGKLLSVTDALGNKVFYAYNGRDELTGILQLADGEELTFLTEEKEPHLDKDWQMIAEHNRQNHDLHLTLFTRDVAGQTIKVTDALGREDCYEYDVMGRVSRRIDQEGKETSWEYHPDGQIKSILYPDGKKAAYGYDALARLQEVKDWLGKTVFAYDAKGRIIKSTDHKGDTITYGWNPDGTKDYMTYPDGNRTTYHYDHAGRLTDIQDGEFRIEYTYDACGRVSACKRNNGMETLYAYDKAGYLRGLTHHDKDGILEEYSCTYDLTGNKTSVTRKSRDTAYSLAQEYAYDAVNRLTEIWENGQPVTCYQYDGYGNRIEEWQYHADGKPTVTNRTCDAMNRLITDGEHSYTYDSLGNLTGVSKAGQIQQSYAYDTTGLLDKMEQDGRTEQYQNNSLGCRVGMTSDIGTIAYGIDYAGPYKRITTQKDSNGTHRNYLWHDNTLLGIPNEGIHILPDLFHSPVRVTDKEGNTQNLYSYDAYGNLLRQQECISMPFGYTGYLKETGSNLYYTGSREYNPASTNFTSKDKYRYMNTRDPQSINLYAYAKSNPLRYLDFDGHECIEEVNYLELLNTYSDIYEKEENEFLLVKRCLQDGYVMTAEEERQIEKLLKEYFSIRENKFSLDLADSVGPENIFYSNMVDYTPQEYQKFNEMYYLYRKADDVEAFSYGLYSNFILTQPFMYGGLLDRLLGYPNVTKDREHVQAAVEQNRTSYIIGSIVGGGFSFILGASVMKKIPGLGELFAKAGQKLSKLPVIGKLGADSLTNIVADTTLDTAMDTIPSMVEMAMDGESGSEIAKEGLKKTGISLGINGAYEATFKAGKVALEKVLGTKPVKTDAGTYQGGSDVIETVSKTNPFDLQPTHSPTLSKNKMNALMDDIKVNGIQQPIKYVEYNGQMYVVDGHHRLLAAKRLGLTEVPIEKVDLPYAGYNTIDDLLWFE